jgi:hypothetical protein
MSTVRLPVTKAATTGIDLFATAARLQPALVLARYSGLPAEQHLQKTRDNQKDNQ